MTSVLLLATTNQGKTAELRAALADIPGLTVINAAELPDTAALDVPETGATFAANAYLKAHAYAEASGMPTLADDSGLEIAALDGFPGVQSARWLGDTASDNERNLGILEKMQHITDRRARYVAALAFVDPIQGMAVDFEGLCGGKIATEPHGTGGFGYDPIFIPNAGDGRAFGELPKAFKAAHSHRAKAIARFRRFLVAMR
jgi:XTP/dITP diphosphohydrolase